MVLLLERDMRENFPMPRLGIKLKWDTSGFKMTPCQILGLFAVLGGTKLLRVPSLSGLWYGSAY